MLQKLSQRNKSFNIIESRIFLSFGSLERSDTEIISFQENGIPFLEKGGWGRGL